MDASETPLLTCPHQLLARVRGTRRDQRPISSATLRGLQKPCSIELRPDMTVAELRSGVKQELDGIVDVRLLLNTQELSDKANTQVELQAVVTKSPTDAGVGTGVGTGIPATLLGRVAHFVRTGAKPINIIFLIFTNKSADDIGLFPPLCFSSAVKDFELILCVERAGNPSRDRFIFLHVLEKNCAG